MHLTLSDAQNVIASIQLAEASKELTASLEEIHKAVIDVRLNERKKK
jgi:hypothetical protein